MRNVVRVLYTSLTNILINTNTMFKERVIGCIISVMLVSGCTEDEKVNAGQNYQDFWQGVTQEVEQRSNKRMLAVNDSLLLSKRFGILNATDLKMKGENLYIKDRAKQEIFAIDKRTLKHRASIHRRKVADLENSRDSDHLMCHLNR